MIPKRIHYCWFGEKPLPKAAQKCIASWKKYCPDYELVRWDETNFDININTYVIEAYEAGKYAFVTDYVRLYAMYHFGGIYMDMDVEVVAKLDGFLNHQAFSGFENDKFIPTGIMAGEKGFPLFGTLLDYYKDKSFYKPDGSEDWTTNTYIITSLLTQKGFAANGCYQEIEGFALYPRDYFCPFDDSTGKLARTKNTATIHWFNKSWMERRYVFRNKFTRPFHRIFGIECFRWLKRGVQ